jgi:hypothetical protein
VPKNLTRKQAREYATRIRLGEPLFFWSEPGTPSGKEYACFADKTLLAVALSRSLAARGVRVGDSDSWNTANSPDANRVPAEYPARWEPLMTRNCEAVLVLLDRIAGPAK